MTPELDDQLEEDMAAVMMAEEDRPVLIFDASAGRPHARYQELLHHCDFYSLVPEPLEDVRSHSHGFDVAWCFANQTLRPQTIVLARIFGENGEGVAGLEDWMFSIWEDLNPATVIMASGRADGDSKWGDLMAEVIYPSEWRHRFVELVEACQTDVFFAAGNDDKNDADVDIDYPQRVMPESDQMHIIGSCNADGVPSVFSGDGPNVRCLYLGEDCRVCDGLTGEVRRFSGTSAAVAHAAGDAAAHNLRGVDYVDYVKAFATTPENFKGPLPHPKAGWGVMEWSRQANLQDAGIQALLEDLSEGGF